MNFTICYQQIDHQSIIVNVSSFRLLSLLKYKTPMTKLTDNDNANFDLNLINLFYINYLNPLVASMYIINDSS